MEPCQGYIENSIYKIGVWYFSLMVETDIVTRSLFISQTYYLDMFNYFWKYAMTLNMKNNSVALLFGPFVPLWKCCLLDHFFSGATVCQTS